MDTDLATLGLLKPSLFGIGIGWAANNLHSFWRSELADNLYNESYYANDQYVSNW